MASDARIITQLEIEANRFHLLSRIADDLAHEIKNPLHAMVINLELVKRRAEAGDIATARQRADMVGAEVVRVNAMIDQLLQLLRPARQNDPVVDVDRTVDELMPLLVQQARLTHVDLVYNGIEAPVPAPIRRDALKLVLLNIMAGALERLRASGGRLEISAHSRDDEVGLVVMGSGPAASASAPAAPGPVEDDEHRNLARAVVRHLVEAAGGEYSESGDEEPAAMFWALRFPRAAHA